MNPNRRQILQATGALSITALAPRVNLGASSFVRDKLRVAAVGIGGRGKADLDGMSNHKAFQLEAVCDVDKQFYKNGQKYNSNVACFQDYRKMFDEKSDDFDAVLIATPDHMHAPIALLALDAGKHVYLQKPLAQDIAECRKLAKVAQSKPDQVTQMGIQIHSHPAYRTAVKWLQKGVVGKISEVHSWSGKGWGGKIADKPASPIPESLDWDLYCGVSDHVAYVKDFYHRNNWRKWMNFGTGTQGDMGCHIVDPVFNALKIGRPKTVKSLGPKPFEKNFALISHVEYEFEGTEFTTEVLPLSWYNGDLRPKRIDNLPQGIELPYQGSVFVGEKGSVVLPHIGAPVVYGPDGQVRKDLPEPADSRNHFHDWIDASLGQKEKATARFEYSGPLTEAVLLGTIINRWPNRSFDWNPDKCMFHGDDDAVKQANALLQPAYRSGW